MKDYKKILEGVVNIISTTEKSDIGFANICTYIGENCPELQESEDERIRKELIYFVQGFIECHDKPDAERDEKYESWIAWLENQKKVQRQIDDAYLKGIVDAKRELEKQTK